MGKVIIRPKSLPKIAEMASVPYFKLWAWYRGVTVRSSFSEAQLLRIADAFDQAKRPLNDGREKALKEIEELKKQGL